MLDQDFIINTDRLRNSKELKVRVDLKIPSNFLEVEDSELSFRQMVELQGEIYIVDDQLILHFDVLATVISECSICNRNADTEIKIKNFYHVEDLTKIKAPYFDFSSVLREEVLLEAPQFAECNQGSCPDRELIKPYLVERKQ